MTAEGQMAFSFANPKDRLKPPELTRGKRAPCAHHDHRTSSELIWHCSCDRNEHFILWGWIHGHSVGLIMLVEAHASLLTRLRHSTAYVHKELHLVETRLCQLEPKEKKIWPLCQRRVPKTQLLPNIRLSKPKTTLSTALVMPRG